jgi:gamma-glutamyltranspeptidase/glutathione hydrolase
MGNCNGKEEQELQQQQNRSTTTSTTSTTPAPKPLPFNSRRSPLTCLNGCIATSQPLASSVGLQILLKGGNAADAAVAAAAAIAVLEPCSTGLGGDMFSLYYDAKEKRVSAINGSGRCPGKMNIDLLKERLPAKSSSSSTGIDSAKFEKSVYAITMPGAARGWEDFYNKYASKKFTFAELLEPGAKIAEEGFPVGLVTSTAWKQGLEEDIKKWCTKEEIKSGNVPLSINGSAPKAGEVMINKDMAKVLRLLGKNGATKGFYESFVGDAIVKAVQKYGGVMTKDDLKEKHTQSTYPEPISVEYHGIKLHQVPPNGQGIAGLIALSGLAALEEKGTIPKSEATDSVNGWKSSQTWHAMIEMMRLGFGDARKFVCDTDFCKGRENVKSNEYLLDKKRISDRAERLFDTQKATIQGIPDPASGTISFQVVDSEGNAVSFVNSNYEGFGTGLVPDGCGFTLQNRGFGFSLDPNHLNAMEPYKRPFHTIIPGMLTHADNGDLYATISNMGGFMQPQGHMQLTVGMVGAGLNPQAAIDMPRFIIFDGTHDGDVLIEEGVDEAIILDLQRKKHKMKPNQSGYNRTKFGKAQIIKRDRKTGVLWAGSEGRADGCAYGY